MEETRITKSDGVRIVSNMTDYDALSAAFSWQQGRALIDGLPGGKMNIAHEAVDRHVSAGYADQLALRWITKSGQRHDFTYGDLQREANRFANVLRAQGFQKGDRVYALLGRVPQLYIAALGTLKAGCTFCPLFSAFGPEPIRARMEIGGANALVTSARLYKRKVKGLRPDLPDLRQVFVIDDAAENTLPLADLMRVAPDHFKTEPMDPEETALLHFTSGTTGKPKGVVHVHDAVVAHNWTGHIALDLRAGDIYWCTADPGWVTGTSYGIVAPLTNRTSMIVDEAEFDVTRWYDILQNERVTVWYTAPTAIRMLMKAGTEAMQGYDFSALRFMASVGEPLNPEAVIWGNASFGQPFHDNWWQTETGGIMIANYAAADVKPGSMGQPLPGITAGIVEMDGDSGALREVTEPGAMGELALRAGWPSMMRGYLHEQARYDKCFRDGWYLTGDLAMRDADGYFWFVGRADDLIKSAGHLIGPFEVESALMEHPAVAEVGVIGIPDETAGELVKAYVALKPGYEPSEDLRLDLLGHARKHLGPAVAPKDIAFRQNLPKTRSGKIMRRLLKARELGLPEGDISTLESDES
ncbi:acetate--CoA ligase [Phaeobacter sp. QD34_3]|uniref:acetate--CoA ligase n=1 Tax=unclassified Phaeobacter TaxID=2621772 RepID=UPI00237F9E6B|nr:MULTISPECIES: acetate--CoA ligase [unclassified Phaeobacter]MDE4132268.1 acetate--CoA ligase [Phaeobacter sp. QD34_3]MDE4135906.1 acetate--CoA ligase [Phaeobacter sp. QD34_24]MDE4173728.1 acetate--CoA ligase [Phaeobacter sp. PT47_59]